MTFSRRQAVCLAIVLCVNALFIVKYGARITEAVAGLLVAYAASIGLLLYSIRKLPDVTRRPLFWVASLACCLVVLGAYVVIPQESLGVDRYEMIRLFWDNLFDGINPYTRRPEGGNIPGPFPAYFYLALPFYLIGELGLYTLSGFLLFAWLLQRYVSDAQTRLVVLALLLSSPAYAWELITRSTLVLNTVLILGYILYVHHADLRRAGRLMGSAVLFGLLLSTRSIVLVALAPLIPLLIERGIDIRKLILWSALAGSVFLLTFVPMLFFETFMEGLNPIQVQAKFFPTWFPLLILLGCVGYVALRPTLSRHLLASAIGMTILTASYVTIEALDHGFHAMLFQSRADISYLLLPFPFLLFVLAKDGMSRECSAERTPREAQREAERPA